MCTPIRPVARFAIAAGALLASLPGVVLAQATTTPTFGIAPPPPVVAPPAPATAARVLPTLSRTQARQLAAMIDAAAAQGLRHDLRDGDGAAADRGDADLIAAALDHARAVHSGRLDTSDFLRDWGLRPAA